MLRDALRDAIRCYMIPWSLSHINNVRHIVTNGGIVWCFVWRNEMHDILRQTVTLCDASCDVMKCMTSCDKRWHCVMLHATVWNAWHLVTNGDIVWCFVWRNEKPDILWQMVTLCDASCDVMKCPTSCDKRWHCVMLRVPLWNAQHPVTNNGNSVMLYDTTRRLFLFLSAVIVAVS